MNKLIYQKDGEWYFYDESLTIKYGPFKTEQEALTTFYLYCDYLDIGCREGKRESCPNNWDLVFIILLGMVIMGVLIWVAF